jgi:hypothetical protein
MVKIATYSNQRSTGGGTTASRLARTATPCRAASTLPFIGRPARDAHRPGSFIADLAMGRDILTGIVSR